MSTETVTAIRLHLPEHLYTEYEKQAAAAGMPLESLMTQRLHECRDMDSFVGRSLKLTPAERQHLEKIAERGFKTGADVVQFVEYMASIRVHEVSIPLSKELLTRLETRAIRMEFKKYLAELVVKGLEHFAGMR